MDASYYNAAPVFLRQPVSFPPHFLEYCIYNSELQLNYLLYTPFTPAEQVRNPQATHFIPSSVDLRQTLQERSETARTVNLVDLGLPEELQGYHTLVPIEPVNVAAADRKKIGNWYSTVYRAIRTSDGAAHCLRRIESTLNLRQK